jgi:hypothetical protein
MGGVHEVLQHLLLAIIAVIIIRRSFGNMADYRADCEDDEEPQEIFDLGTLFHQVCREQNLNQIVICRAYIGNTRGVNSEPFMEAIREFKIAANHAKVNSLDDRMYKTYVFEQKNLRDILNMRREDGKPWGPFDLCHWLSECHAHFITSHPGQKNGWDLAEIREALKILRDHPGFPMGEQLECPIFLQEKDGYRQACEFYNIAIPTLSKYDKYHNYNDILLGLILDNFFCSHPDKTL